MTLTSSSSSSSSSSHPISISISKSKSASTSNDNLFQSKPNHTSNGSDRELIDTLHAPIITSITHINHRPIRLCDLAHDQAGLDHTLQEAIRQQTLSLQSTTQHTESHYALDQTLGQLTGSDESTLFGHSDTVQALEQILHSQIFEMVSQQPTQHDTNHHHHPIESQLNISSLSDNTLNHGHSKVDSQILNNEDLFKAAAACLQHEDDRDGLNTHHHQPSDSSNRNHDMNTLNSPQALSNEPVDMFIDPRLHSELSASDEIVQVDSFKTANQTFNHSESGSSDQLGLQYGMGMNDRLSQISNQPTDRRISTEGLAFGLDLSRNFEDSDLPAQLEMILSQDIHSTNCSNQMNFSSTTFCHNESSERILTNPPKRTKVGRDASRSWMRRPSSSLSALLIHNDMSTPCRIRTRASASPKRSQSISMTSDPNVHPLLQSMEHEETEASPQMNSSSIRLNRSSRKRTRSSSDHEDRFESSHSNESEDDESDHSTPKSPKLNQSEEEENFSTSSLNHLSEKGIDVHGSGAGGGAAAILESIYLSTSDPLNTNPRKMKNKFPLTSSLCSSYIETPTSPKPTRTIIATTNGSLKNGVGSEEREVEEVPESYFPDQFRSFNRIHWTKEEEELLLEEVELNYQRYDCMSHIMKRHGPNGTISKTFSDRTGVSLKDKAVNISSRWYRDGTEVSDLRRKAFARFRPKQLKGKLKSELPGMKLLLESSSAASTSFDFDHDHDHQNQNQNQNQLDKPKTGADNEQENKRRKRVFFRCN